MELSHFAKGHELFRRTYFKNHESEFIALAQGGQQPKALFIGCSDSRVIPDLIVQSKPGDLFVLRNVGNFVPPYQIAEAYQTTGAGIEYAVKVLNVSEIIICGHTHCGACAALYNSPESLASMPHLTKWLLLGQHAKEMTISTLGSDANHDELLRMTERMSIVTQINNLMTYPFVLERMNEEKLYIHGWYYDIETGNIEYYDPEKYQFLPLINAAPMEAE